MCAAVTRHTLLMRPGEDGTVLFDHLQQVEKSTGKWPEEYEPIPPPDGTEYVWDIFWELRTTAPPGFSGPGRIGFSDLAAWESVRGERLENFVVDLIVRMDSAYMAEAYRDRKQRAESHG